MPRGSKSKYTSRQKRQARHIEASAKERGYTSKRAAEIGWATVNKQDGGGKKSGGGGRGKKRSNVSSRAGGRASHRRTRGGSRAQHAKAGRASHRG
ncbi:MAG: plasmid stabilization protein [Deltaproteobacteria bacterium]|nr:plasmid stabilization protein [Deltaproteobacteria bacterium]